MTGLALLAACAPTLRGTASSDDTAGDRPWPYHGDAATLIWAELPEFLPCGEPVEGWVEVENTGSSTWSAGHGYALGAVADEDPFAGSLHSELPPGVEVRTGEAWTFEIELCAVEPTIGTSDWRMVNDQTWFGDVAVAHIEADCEPDAPPSWSDQGGQLRLRPMRCPPRPR